MWLGQAWNDLGLVSMVRGEFRLALRQHQKALAFRRKSGDEAGIASSYSKIGNCHVELHQVNEGLEAHFQALKRFRKLGNPTGISYTLYNLCAIFLDQKRYDYLKQYSRESYSLSQRTGDKSGMANALEHLSTVKLKEGDIQGALENERQATRLAAEIKDTFLLAGCLNNLGYLYSYIQDHKRAEKQYRDALKLIQIWSQPDSNGLILYAANLGNKLMVNRRFFSSDSVLRYALAISERSGLQKHKPQIYKTMGDLFVQRGLTDSALLYYDKFAEVKEAQFSSNMAETFADLQTQYEIDVREQEKAQLRQENELKTQRLRSWQVGGVALALVLALSVMGFLFWQGREKALQQKLEAEAALKAREAQTKAILEAEEQERKRIARDLHDGVGQVLSAARLQLSAFETESELPEPGKIKKTLDLMDQAVRDVRAVAHSMLAHTVSQRGLGPALEDLVSQIHGSGKIQAEFHCSGLEVSLNPILGTAVFRMVQEILSNVVRHSGATRLDVQLHLHEGELVLLVEDNGKGFDPALQGAGAGLQNLRSRVAQFHGQLEIDSQPGRGCTISIEIPVGI
jgi:signal transduction histidine kinase